MANVIFACPHCGRRMGVNRDWLGRAVRCPHCKQVVYAPAVEGGVATTVAPKPAPLSDSPALSPPVPTPATTSPATTSATTPAAPTPVSETASSTPAPAPASSAASPATAPPASPLISPATAPSPQNPPGDLPTFSVPTTRESSDSILGEEDESEDEVFASRSPSAKLLPDLSAFAPRLSSGGHMAMVPPPPSATPPGFTEVVVEAPVAASAGATAQTATIPGLPPAEPPPIWSGALNLKPLPDTTSAAASHASMARPSPPAPAATPTPPTQPPSNPWAAFQLPGMPAPFQPPTGSLPTPDAPGILSTAPSVPSSAGSVIPPLKMPEPPAGVEPLSPPSASTGFVPEFLTLAPPTVPAPPAVPPPGNAAPAFPPTTDSPAMPLTDAGQPQVPAPAASEDDASTASASPFSLASSPKSEAISPAFIPATQAPSRDSGRKRSWGLVALLLFLYALAATGAAVYAFFFHHAPADTVAPPADLSTIPDVFGQYPPAERKKVSQLSLPLQGPLPDHLKVKLYESLTVGQLQVKPLAVEQRPIYVYQQFKSGKQPTKVRLGSTPGLVLRLQLKNLSTDVWFHPTDPAFVRIYDPNKNQPTPGTGLLIAGRSFWGGPCRWPFADADTANTISEEYFEGQEQDSQPLAPGQERETVIVAPRDPQIMKLLDTPGIGPIIWRVQLRRGLEMIRDRELPVTAIVGVEFLPKEVQVKG